MKYRSLHKAMALAFAVHSGVCLPEGVGIALSEAVARPTAGYRRTETRYAIPDAVLTDRSGRSVRLAELVDGEHPVMLDFVFASCTSFCPLLTAAFAKVQRSLPAEAASVRLVSISIDPEQDTPERLRSYADRFKAGPGWYFLTGDRNALEGVQKAFDAYRGGKTNHPSLVLVHAGKGRPWVRLEGSLSASALVDELNKARMGE
jgi:protein SCO1/2